MNYFKWAWRWLIGKQPYTLTLDACAQTAHVLGGYAILMTAHRLGGPWWAGWVITVACVVYKEFFNDIRNEHASYADGAKDGLFYLLGGLLAQVILL